MKRACLAAVVAAAFALAALVPAAVARAGDSPTTYYLSLGDSLAASFQPTFDLSHGYAEQLYASLVVSEPKLELVKLGCGAETTVTFVSGQPGCQPSFLYPNTIYPHRTQLAEAVNFLHAHAKQVSLVTIDIGGNDVVGCIAALDVGCFNAGLADVQERLPQILAALRDAAGPSVAIVGMTYYDPLSIFWFADPAAGQAADGLMTELNDALQQIYTAAGAPVAQVDDAFEVGTFPASALNTCQWTWACASKPPGYLGPWPDVHANTAGYGVIAQAFEQVLP